MDIGPFWSFIVPTIITVESYMAGFVYLYYNMWGSALYWCSAGTINLAVIFLIKRFG
jgi:hypothetical protein